MRRSMIAYLAGAVAMAACVAAFTWFGNQETVHRYHQHRQWPDEAELGPCGVCGGKTALCTHLPVINIATGGQKIPGRPLTDETGHTFTYELGEGGEEEIEVSLSTVATEGVWHHADDAPTHVSRAMMRIRGNTSRWFDKPNYRVRLVAGGQPGQERALPLLGMNDGTEWSLHGPFLDKTLMRNYVWMNISAEVMGYAPNVRFCELMLDGKYQGVYLLMETISVQEARVDLTRYTEGDLVTSYLVRLDYNINPQKMCPDFSTYTYRLEIGTGMEIIYPGLRRQTEYIRNYIAADLSKIEKALYSSEILSGYYSYTDDIDVDSFINFYILHELAGINDAFSASTYFYRDARGKLTIGPAWDYNNALDNYVKPLSQHQFMLSQRNVYGRLMTDPEFVDRVISRYLTLRTGLLSDWRLAQYHAEVEMWLGRAVDRNFEVWGYSFDPDLLNERTRRTPYENDENTIYDINPKSYDEAMNMMLKYMFDRNKWLDEHIESLRQYCHPSKNAMWIPY